MYSRRKASCGGYRRTMELQELYSLSRGKMQEQSIEEWVNDWQRDWHCMFGSTRPILWAVAIIGRTWSRRSSLRTLGRDAWRETRRNSTKSSKSQSEWACWCLRTRRRTRCGNAWHQSARRAGSNMPTNSTGTLRRKTLSFDCQICHHPNRDNNSPFRYLAFVGGGDWRLSHLGLSPYFR